MKKSLYALLVFLMLLLCGCSNTNQKAPEIEQSTAGIQTTKAFQNQRVIFPNANVTSANWDHMFQKATHIDAFTIQDKIGRYYLGEKSVYHSDRQEIDGT